MKYILQLDYPDEYYHPDIDYDLKRLIIHFCFLSLEGIHAVVLLNSQFPNPGIQSFIDRHLDYIFKYGGEMVMQRARTQGKFFTDNPQHDREMMVNELGEILPRRPELLNMVRGILTPFMLQVCRHMGTNLSYLQWFDESPDSHAMVRRTDYHIQVEFVMGVGYGG